MKHCFLILMLAGALIALAPGLPQAADSTVPAASAGADWPPFEIGKPVPVTRGPGHHFFGYFDITPWDATGRYMLSLETDFHDRMPEASDAATIGLVDLEHGRKFIPVTQTFAWNFQQGAFQRWLPTAPDRLIIYNDREGTRLVSRIRDVWSGDTHTLPRPVSDVSDDGTQALSINYARLSRLRPVIGYPGTADPTEGVDQPADDGVWAMDPATGESRLLVSIADVARAYKGNTDLAGKTMWLSHTRYNPSGTRFLFLARYLTALSAFDTAMFTADARDGSDLRRVIDFGRGVSHFGWIDDNTLLATMDLSEQGKGSAFVRFEDKDGQTDYSRIGADFLIEDGHPAISPNGRWLVADTYPDASQRQTLFLMDLQTGRHVVLGRFKHPVRYFSALRCDLHPRWSRDGSTISFDSLDGKGRQMSVIRFTPAPPG